MTREFIFFSNAQNIYQSAIKGVPGSAVTNPTRTHEDTGSIPGLTQWVRVQGCRELWCGRRRSSDPTLLWLWCRPAAVARILPLALELPYANGAALKRPRKKKKILLKPEVGKQEIPRKFHMWGFNTIFLKTQGSKENDHNWNEKVQTGWWWNYMNLVWLVENNEVSKKDAVNGIPFCDWEEGKLPEYWIKGSILIKFITLTILHTSTDPLTLCSSARVAKFTWKPIMLRETAILFPLQSDFPTIYPTA